MYFKACTFMQLPPHICDMLKADLNKALLTLPLKPVGPNEMDRMGFVPAFRDPDALPADVEGDDAHEGDEDPLYVEAMAIVVDSQKSSISHLQRRLKIGYTRAARLSETMEERGIVSAPAHNGDRTVLVRVVTGQKLSADPKSDDEVIDDLPWPLWIDEHRCIVCIGGEHRKLPRPAIDKEVAKRVKERESEKDVLGDRTRVSARTRAEIKSQVIAEMVPKAPVVDSRSYMLIDLQGRFIAIDGAPNKAAVLIGILRQAVGTLPAVPLENDLPAEAALRAVYNGDSQNFRWAGAAQLRDMGDAKVTLKDVETGAVDPHLEDGMFFHSLRVVDVDGKLELTIDRDLAISQIRFLDDALATIEERQRNAETADDELAARVWLNATLLRELYGRITDLFACPDVFEEAETVRDDQLV